MSVAIILLRASVALIMIAFGINQFILPHEWLEYVPPWMKKDSAMAPELLVRWNSVGNLIVGLLLISGLFPLPAAWIAFIWWISILPFAFMYKWSLGLRDTSIAISLLALIFLLS